MGTRPGGENLANLNRALQGMSGTLVLLFTVPIVAAVVAETLADENVTGTTKLIVGFVGTLYALGVLIFCTRSFLGGGGRR